MPKEPSPETERLGPRAHHVAVPTEVWLVDGEGQIEGTPPEPALAAAILNVAEETRKTGEALSTESTLSLQAGVRVLGLHTRLTSRGDVVVVATWLDQVKSLEKDVSRYDLVFRATRDAIWEWNIVTRESWWNRRLFELLGYDPDTTPSSYEAWIAGVHPDDRERVVRHFNEAVAGTAMTWQDEFRFVRADGGSGVVLDRGYIERDQLGQPLRMIGLMSDITEQRAASHALEVSEERFRQLTAAIDQVFWMVNPQGTQVLYVSPAYETIWGRSCQSVYDNPMSFAEAIHEDDRDRMLANLPGKAGYDEIYRIRRPDGHIAWIRDRAFPVHDTGGSVVGIAGVATDITTQRKLEEQLLQSQKLESIGRLAGGVAHDFNNLITVILSGTDFAMRELATPEAARQDLEQVKDAAERAAGLTAQLLAFARRQVVAPRLLDLNDLAQRMHELLRRLIGEHVRLNAVLAPALHPVLADPGQLEQVLLNLAVNARDAMPDGGRLTIETANVNVDRAYADSHPNLEVGDYVMLAVSDTGVGIPPDLLAHIFEPFFTTKHSGRGTGLGLATCYGTIRQAGGQILVYSEQGKGSTFKILLPRAGDETAAESSRTPQQPATGGTETVLIVEDHAVLRGVAVRILREHGYEVLHAAGGAEALELAKSHAGLIHLLVTDVVMPDMSGVELARRLLEARPGTRVLYTSGYTENTIVHHGVLEAKVAFLPKPYVAAKLLGAVRSVLDKS